MISNCQATKFLIITIFGVTLLSSLPKLLDLSSFSNSDESNTQTVLHIKEYEHHDDKIMLTNASTVLEKSEENEYHDDHLILNHLTCQRSCPKRINKIYWVHKAAGLGDRKNILRDLTNLAGYLCAEVVVPPPRVLLHPRHNNWKEVSKSVPWSDLFNVTFIEDGNPAIRSMTAEVGEDFDSWFETPVFDVNSEASKYKDWLHVVSRNDGLMEDFERIQTFSFQQEVQNPSNGFIWEIHDSWYDLDLLKTKLPDLPQKIQKVVKDEGYNYQKMRPLMVTFLPIQNGCVYTNSDTKPSHLKIMQKRLLNRLRRHSPEDSIYGSLHLRRGDVIDNCDTSVDRMREYFACSLNGTEALGRNITLLMKTDEVDPEYRLSIMKLIDEYAHVSILDVDEIVTKVVHEAIRNGIISENLNNNFYVFDIENVIRDFESEFTMFSLVRRRYICTDCIKLAEQISNILYLDHSP